MCGIIGRWNKKKAINKHEFCLARDSMEHRGPDGFGEYFNNDQSVALGHRRLSFMDLSETGQQPMCNEDRSIWITVNGEIYNYRELRPQLEKKGHIFNSGCDSEVILHAWEEWGVDCINKLKGMFAFGLYDCKKNQMFIARDRFGIKPLYFKYSNEHFIFASELKGIVTFTDIKREIDFTSFSDYFVYRYIPSPKTIWKGINKLPAGHYLLLKDNDEPQIIEYWKLQPENLNIPDNEVIERVDRMMEESVKGHLMSDVPVGSFLSGGYDSSALVYYCDRNNYSPKTFSIGFENWNESEHRYAGIVADLFKTEHYDRIVDNSDLDLLETLVKHYDEPIADISIIPTYIVSKSARQKVKTVLSGEGADEIFAGYTWHKSALNMKYARNWIQRTLSRSIKGIKPYSVDEYSDAMAMGKFEAKHLRQLLNDDLHDDINNDTDWFYRQHYKPEVSPVKRFQYMDVKTFMGELVLTKIDRASMANSLEVRVPFLDHELVEYMFSISEKTYFKENYQKYILYSNLKSVMPSEILSRRKQGFVGPDKYYMNFEWYRNNLKDGYLIKDKLINEEIIDHWLTNKDHWRLWKTAVMEKWYAEWCK